MTRALHLPALAAALLALALPAAASAKPRDRNHDGIADRWAKRHHVRGARKDLDRDGLTNRGEFLSRTDPRRADSDGDGVSDANEDPDRDGVDNGNEVREHTNPRRRDSDRDGRKDGQEDADRDRLSNTGEDQSGNDPIDADTDGDGVKDGDEGAGTVTALDGTHLEVRLFTGATIAGAVDGDTEVWCEDDAGDDSTGDTGDDESGDDTGPSCTIEDIEVGSVVRSASIDFGQDGTYFSSLELAP